MINNLKQLGLSEKQAKVYLASLSLGSATAQEIADKAEVNRPTTYVQIEFLMNLGLMSSLTRGKKRYFTPEPPKELKNLLNSQKQKLVSKEQNLKDFLPELEDIFALIGEKPKMRFYEGKAGIQAIQKDILNTKTDTLEEIIPLDEAYKNFPPNPKDHRSSMNKKFKNIPRRIIYTSSKGRFLPKEEGKKINKYIPQEKFSIDAEIDIYGEDRVAVITTKKKLVGIIIENKEINSTLRSFFELAWQGAEKYQK